MVPLLEFNNVSCDSDDVLENVSFAVYPGENAMFFGVEGSGLKIVTPLILSVEGLYDGDILYKGKVIRSLDYLGKLSYKNDIGYVHGDYGLISNMNVEQNISLRLEYYSEYSIADIREITERLMRELGIIDKRKARPVELTSSQIFRTAYGRAVAHDPDLLIIEHAFMGQSPLNIRSFMDVLKKRVENPDKSVIFVTYEPQKFVDFADTFHMLYRGRIVFTGTRQEFLESDNPYLVQYRNTSLQGPMDIL
jgi:phospholipid/cholesterol/gamma-HCH transport system ATP-binding protein